VGAVESATTVKAEAPELVPALLVAVTFWLPLGGVGVPFQE
jgi:hypothetical protein